MASGSQNMTTYVAKQVIGSNFASTPEGALLQSGAGRADDSATGDTWLFLNTVNSTTNPWGIFHSQVDNKIKIIGDGTDDFWVDMDTGDTYILGNVGIGYNPETSGNTYKLYVNGATRIDGTLHIFPNSGNYTEGIRIHSYSSWSDITLCGNDNTGDNDTSANSWFIGNNNGSFYISRNGSPGTTAYLSCINNVWNFLNQVTFGARVTSTAPSALTNVDRIVITPYYHTDGPWKITSRDDSSNAYLSLYYSTTETARMQHNGALLLCNNISFTNSGTAFRGINYGTMGDNDQWRIGGAATAANAGYMELATADDGNEPVYARQYTGAFATIKRTLTLLDANGNTTVPGGFGVANTSNSTGLGISLYNGAANGVPEYGMFFGGTATFGKFGDVSNDWATYFTMNRNDTRGWIFKSNGATANSSNNYASISGRGHFTGTLSPSSWIDGQRYMNATYNIADYSNTGSYNPWMRATNTWASGDSNAKKGYWFSFGTLGTRFYWIGSASTRTENSYDKGMSFDISNGILYATFSGNLTGNVTGNCSGSSGSCTGNAASATYLKDRTNSTATYSNYGAAGLAASAMTWFTCWNGYELRGISKAETMAAVRGAASGSWAISVTGNSNTANYQNCVHTNEIRYARNGNMSSATSLWQGWAFAEGKVAVINDWRFGNGNGGLAPIYGSKVYNAVWNDYAECRASDEIEPGLVVVDDISGKMQRSTIRLQAGAHIISDTYGHLIGESDEAKTPIGVSGRVLVTPYQPRENYKIGDVLCAAPNGTADIMTREEIREYPDRIIGIVSEIPEYDTWTQIFSDYKDVRDKEKVEQARAEIPVNGRIWVYIK